MTGSTPPAQEPAAAAKSPAPQPAVPATGPARPSALARSGSTQPPPVAWPAQPLPPRQRSAFDRRWPGPAGPARPQVLTAVAGAAVIGGLSIPDVPGVGWLVTVLAGLAALVTAVHFRDPAGADWRRLGWIRLGWAAVTVALVGVGAVRAAGWLFVLCLLTAGMTAGLALVDGRSLRGILLSLALPPVAVFRSLPWASAGLGDQASRGGGRAGSPGSHGQASSPAGGPDDGTDAAAAAGRPQIGRILLTVAVSAALLLVFGSLFASADAAFGRLLSAALPEISVEGTVRWAFLSAVVGAGLLGAAYLLTRPPDMTGLAGGGTHRRVQRWEWGVPVALLDGLFLAFVLVQVTVLFGGGTHVLRTEGLTYAEHARGGFWQLLVVSGLTLLVLAGAVRWAPRDTAADRLLIRLLLGALALLSLVVVASALYRMEVYTDAYGATRLRLLVTVAELWIGLLFVLVLAAGVRLRAGWLPAVAVTSAVLALLGLALLNPDRWIAERNVARYEQTGRVDVSYLSGLSADAVPALDRLPAPLRDCALGSISNRLDADDAEGDWRAANLGRTVARRLLGESPVRAPNQSECWRHG